MCPRGISRFVRQLVHSRLAPAGALRVFTDALVNDSGAHDPVALGAPQTPVEDLPDDVLRFLLASRYCEADLLMPIAWQLFANTPPGWGRVQAICDFVHNHIQFGYGSLGRQRRRGRSITKGPVYAATLLTLRLHSAGR